MPHSQSWTGNYSIERGDSLFTIAKKLGTTVTALLQANPDLTDPAAVAPGRTIRVPSFRTSRVEGCIVYISDRTGTPEVWLSDPDGGRHAQLRLARIGCSMKPSRPLWSPDGRRLAVQYDEALVVVEPPGPKYTRIAHTVTAFSWSPDGSLIAYSTADGSYISDTYGQSRLISDRMHSPAWYPDGRTLVGSVDAPGLDYRVLASVGSDGSRLRILDDPVIPADFAIVSPDGRFIATEVLATTDGSVARVLHVYDIARREVVRLPGSNVESPSGELSDISCLGGWLPDSSGITYTTITSSNGYGEVRKASASGELSLRISCGYYPVVTNGPDTSTVILTVSKTPGSRPTISTGPRDIYIRSLTAPDEKRVTASGDNSNPDWMPAKCPFRL